MVIQLPIQGKCLPGEVQSLVKVPEKPAVLRKIGTGCSHQPDASSLLGLSTDAAEGSDGFFKSSRFAKRHSFEEPALQRVLVETHRLEAFSPQRRQVKYLVESALF